jgi:hypothetical protein
MNFSIEHTDSAIKAGKIAFDELKRFGQYARWLDLGSQSFQNMNLQDVLDFQTINKDIPWCIIGSWAMVYYLRRTNQIGYNRPLRDIDILVAQNHAYSIPKSWQLKKEIESKRGYIGVAEIDIMNPKVQLESVVINGIPVVTLESLPFTRSIYTFLRPKETFDLFLMKNAGFLSEKHLGRDEFSNYVFSKILNS